MSETIKLILQYAPGVLAVLGIFAFIISMLKPVRKRINRVLFRGTICLLRHEITTMYYSVKQRGELRDYDRADLIMMYEEYERLGGNCYIKEIYQEMLRYPVL